MVRLTPARRTRGDGGLVQRHDHPTCPPLVNGERPPHRCHGRWAGTIDVTVDGRKKRKYVYGRTQQIARKKLTAALRERDAGTLVIGTLTVEAWLTRWLDRQAKKGRPLKPQTLRGYRSKCRTYVIPHLGRHRLTSLRAHHIEAMYDAMRGEGLAEATVRQTHAILGKALADAERLGLLGANPWKRVEKPGTQKNKRAQLTPAQAAQVLAATDDARWWLALFYGMRQGECLGLRWCDVDFERRTLTIAQTLQVAEDGTRFFDSPKSSASARVLPLVPLMSARLMLHLESHTELEVFSGRLNQDALVFARPDGSPIGPRDDWQAWRDLLTQVGVPQVALHAARNSAASLMEAANVPDRRAAQILGHSSVQITHGYQTADIELMAGDFTAMGTLLELS